MCLLIYMPHALYTEGGVTIEKENFCTCTCFNTFLCNLSSLSPKKLQCQNKRRAKKRGFRLVLSFISFSIHKFHDSHYHLDESNNKHLLFLSSFSKHISHQKHFVCFLNIHRYLFLLLLPNHSDRFHSL